MKNHGVIFGEIDRLIDLSVTRKAFLLVSSGHWIPATDIYETPREIIVVMEIAGVDKNLIDVTYQDSYLIVTGSREELFPKQMTSLHSMEIDTGRFMRKIKINVRIKKEGVEAVCKNGILQITLPKEIGYE
jgi:HSP20 family protein